MTLKKNIIPTGVIIIFCVVTLYFLPLDFNFFTSVIGDLEGADLGGYLWLFWWFDYSLNNDLSFFHVNYLNYPFGENLWLSMPNFLIPILNYPLFSIFGLISSFNIFVLLILTSNAFFMFIFLKFLSDDILFSILGSLFWGFNPFIFWILSTGRIGQLGVFWLPLYTLVVYSIREKGRGKDVIIASLILLLATLWSWNLGILLLVVYAGFILIYIFKLISNQEKDLYQRTVKKMLYHLIFYFILCFPFLRMFILQLNKISLPVTFSNTILNYVNLPGKNYLFATSQPLIEPFFTQNFKLFPRISYLLVGVVFILIFFHRKKRVIWFLLCSGMFYIFSMGPWLKTFGNYSSMIEKPTILLPNYLLFKYIPYYYHFRSVHIFLVGFYFFLITAIIMALKELFLNKSKKIKLSICLIISVCFFIEPIVRKSNYFPITFSTVYSPQCYEYLKDKKGPIVILPLQKIKTGPLLYYQTIHEKKQLNSSFGPDVDKFLIKKFTDFLQKGKQYGGMAVNQKNIDKLRDWKIKYIIVDMNLFVKERVGKYKNKMLRKLIGNPKVFKYNGNKVYFYRLDES